MTLNKPRRRTYVTGDSLPAVTTSSKPFSVAPNEDDNDLGTVRAFVVNIRNRDDTSSVYITEGADGDEVEIAPHEHYPIYEPNGIKSVSLRGDNGGETVEMRVMVAHNDFSVQDKIDAFLRSLSSYVGTATRDTRIVGQDVNVDVGTVDDITTISDTVTVDDITSATATFDVNGPVTIDDITSTSTTFDGDITGQANFNLSQVDREGTPQKRFLRDSGTSATFDNNLGAWIINTNRWTLYSSASMDGLIASISIRFMENGTADFLDEMGVQLEIDNDQKLPREMRAARNIDEWSRNGRETSITRYDEENEVVFRIEPTNPFRFEEGQEVQLTFRPEQWGGADQTDDDYTVECSVEIVERPPA